MRRASLLVAAVACLAACGSSGSSKPPVKHGHGIPITFGIEGGNIVPFTITISSTGKVTEGSGSVRITKKQVSTSLSSAVKADLAGVSSRECKGTLPDVGARFVTAAGRTITVHGSCEPAFETLWGKLTAAVGFD